MKKSAWSVTVEGYPVFQMVVLVGKVDMAEALEIARSIWPNYEVK